MDERSKKEAIDAIANCTNCGDEKTLREYVIKHSLENGWTGGVLQALDAVKDLPSAQPEEDCDTCKHGYFGDAQCERCRVRYPSHYEREVEHHGSD